MATHTEQYLDCFIAVSVEPEEHPMFGTQFRITAIVIKRGDQPVEYSHPVYHGTDEAELARVAMEHARVHIAGQC